MDSRKVIEILKTLPECHLRLIDYAQLVIGENGNPDMEKVSFYSKEIAEAISEAEAYSKATRSAIVCLIMLVRS
jgi:uncharacterized protein YlzI (FlbEa/FlbD family)